MASVEKTIKIIFDADDKTAKAIGSVTRGLGSINDSVAGITNPLASAFDVITKLNVAFAALSATVLLFSLNSARKAEDAIIELNKVMGDTGDVTDEQKQQIKDLARTYAELGTETALSVAEFKRSNFDFAESLGLTEVALKAMNATELDSVQAAELLKRALAGLGLNFKDSEKTIAAGTRIMEVWNNASNIANTTVSEIGEAFKQLAPIMDLTGLTFEETSALATALIESFGEGSEVARGLRTAFIRLADPTADVARALKTLNVDSKDAVGNQRSVADILKDVSVAWQGVDENSRFAIAGQIAGKEQAAKFSKVMQGFNRVLEIHNELKKNTSTLDEELAKRMDSLSFKLRSLTTSYAAVSVSIGESIIDNSKDQIDALTSLAQAFDAVVQDDGLKPLFDLLDPLMKDFSATINNIATNLPNAFGAINFDSLISSFRLFGSEIESIFTAIAGGRIDLDTEEGLTRFLQGLTDAGADFIRISAKMFGSLESVAGGIGDFIDSLQDMDDDTLDAIGGIIGFGKQLNVLSSIIIPAAVGALTLWGTAIAAIKLLAMTNSLGAARAAVVALGGAFATGGLAAASVTIGLLTKALGKAGLVGVIYLAADALNGLLNDTEFGRDVLNATEDFRTAILDMFVFDEIELNIPVSLNTVQMEEQTKAIKDIAVQAKGAYAELTQSINDAFDAQADALTGDEAQRAAAKVIALSGAYADTERSAKKAGDAATNAAESVGSSVEFTQQKTEDAEKSTGRWIKTIVDGITTYEQFGVVAQDAGKKAGDAADEAKKKTESYYLKLLELSSDERISIRKIEVEFDIAKLQAATKQVQSAFESINVGIQSTGELIGDLFGLKNDAKSLREKFDLEDQISKENKFREKQFEEQKRVNDAVIDNFRAQSIRFQDGIQINVDAGTITPHLQAILRSMLVDSKIFMNENGAESLLSCA